MANESNEKFFDELDADLKNIDKFHEPIIYQSKDALVQWHFELPIPTSPGSVVKYSML